MKRVASQISRPILTRTNSIHPHQALPYAQLSEVPTPTLPMPNYTRPDLQDLLSLSGTMSEACFQRFGELPRELRDQIWELSLPGPRIVHLCRQPVQGLWRDQSTNEIVQFRDPEDAGEDGHFNRTTWKFRTDCLAPSALLVCHESNLIASRFYTRAFSGNCSGPAIYFDFAQDHLFLNHESARWSSSWQSGQILCEIRDLERDIQLKMVQNLAIDLSVFRGPDRLLEEERLGAILGYFGGVKLLTLTVELNTHSTRNEVIRPLSRPSYSKIRRCLEFAERGDFTWTTPDEPRYGHVSLSGYRGEEVSVPRLDWGEFQIEYNIAILMRYRHDRMIEGDTPWQLPQINYKVVY